MQPPSSEDSKQLTEWLKIIGGLIAFGIGLYQYRLAQKWKRREFIADQIKDFEADVKIQLAMTMLDWNDRILYFPTEAGEKFIPIRVDEALLCSSFLPPEKAGEYTDEEALIRDCFDRFFDMLLRLEDFVKAQLINTEELRPYLGYWIEIVTGNNRNGHTPELFTLIKYHLRQYGFEKVIRLIEKFGYDSKVDMEDLDHAIQTTLAIRTYQSD